MFVRKSRFRSVSTISKEASRGWSGKLVAMGLQALRAQVRKLRVSSFIFRGIEEEERVLGGSVIVGAVFRCFSSCKFGRCNCSSNNNY